MPTSERRGRATAVGLVLLFASVLLFGVAGVLYGTERSSYASGAVPPNDVTVTQGATYRISIHGGVKAEKARGVVPASVQCEWSTQGSGTQLLSLVAESADSKATNTIATFTAPISGPIHVDCIGLGAAFVDDADNAPFDTAGLFLVLGIVVFVTGLLVLSSGKFTSRPRGSTQRPDHDEEIERLVRLVHVRSEDAAPGGPDQTP